MAIKTLDQFLSESAQKDASPDAFELENPRLVEIRLAGRVWTKAGSMVAYHGDVRFTRQGLAEQGLATLLKKAVSGEGMRLMKAEGKGRVYVADAGKKVTLLRLQGDTIFVNGNDVLAFEDGIESEITMMKRMAGMMSGGLFNVRLSGSGLVAITSHYEPMTLRVSRRDGPVFTDPNAKRVYELVMGTRAGDDVDGLLQVTTSGLIPKCAMKVDRAGDGADLTLYGDPAPCGCYFEKNVPQGTTTCTACTVGNDGPCNGGKCRLGFCEAR